MKRTALALALLALSVTAAAPASAATKKYKDWGASPEAYFLTAAEKQRWEAVSSDDDAEKFIQEYRDARGKGFAPAIQSRIDYADRMFSLGKKKGSTTLRGRVLVLLGSPTRVQEGLVAADGSKLDVSAIDGIAAGSAGSSNPNPYSNSGGPGDSLRNMSGATAERKVQQTWVYGPGTLPTDKAKELVLHFTANPETGKEQVVEAARLEELLTATVAALAPAPAPAPAPKK